jgi:hypothetical protein
MSLSNSIQSHVVTSCPTMCASKMNPRTIDGNAGAVLGGQARQKRQKGAYYIDEEQEAGVNGLSAVGMSRAMTSFEQRRRCCRAGG